MKTLQGCLFTVSALFFSISLQAAPLSIDTSSMKSADESVLMPGAKLVAGNLKKDEFFILGPETKMASNQSVTKSAKSVPNLSNGSIAVALKTDRPSRPSSIKTQNPMSHQLQVALNKASIVSDHQNVAKIKVAMAKTLHTRRHAQYRSRITAVSMNNHKVRHSKFIPHVKELTQVSNTHSSTKHKFVPHVIELSKLAS